MGHGKSHHVNVILPIVTPAVRLQSRFLAENETHSTGRHRAAFQSDSAERAVPGSSPQPRLPIALAIHRRSA